jgi:small subunit ribosomal protein S1
MREQVLDALQVGQEVPGVVTRLQPFGAFVDLGGIDGLVHISDLSYSRVRDPGEVVKVGQQVTVKVLKIDRDSDPVRIGLGLKQTMADPYQTEAGKLAEGGVVTGRVTKIMPFGAFVEIAPGVEGLIHISELSHDRVADVRRVVKEDEVVTVKVLSIDRERQRIGLSLKAMRERLEAEQPRQADNALERLKARFGGDRPLKGGLG